MKYIIKDLNETKDRLKTLESRVAPEVTYFTTATKLNNSVFYIFLFFLLILPISQVFLTIILYIYYGDDNTFNQYIKYGISLLGAVSAVELLALPIYLRYYINLITSKIADIEKKIESS